MTNDRGFDGGWQRPRVLVPLFLWGAVVAVLTLAPGGRTNASVGGLCLICGSRGTADALLNTVLFMPFGFLLAMAGVGGRRVVLACVAVSACIELAQLHTVPGRDASPSDILFNGAGGGVGWVLGVTRGVWIFPRGGTRWGLLGAALLVVFGMPFLTAAAYRPAYPPMPYWGHWAHELENLAPYPGRIVDVRIGDVPLPDRRIPAETGVRERLLGGEPVRILMEAGPQPDLFSQIFGLYSGRQREVLLVGALGTDLVIRHRVAAHRMRLDSRHFRFKDALAGLAPGEDVRIELALVGTGFCARVADRRSCILGPRVGDGWSLLLFPQGLDASVAHAAGFLWLVALWVPLGFWAGSPRAAAVPVVLSAPVFLLYPTMTGLQPLAPGHYPAPALGIVIGALVHRCVMRATPPPGTPASPIALR